MKMILTFLVLIASSAFAQIDRPIRPIPLPLNIYLKTTPKAGQNVFTFAYKTNTVIIRPTPGPRIPRLLYKIFKNDQEVLSQAVSFTKPLANVLTDISSLANDGDIVRLAPGTYAGPIQIGPSSHFSGDVALKQLILEVDGKANDAIITCDTPYSCIEMGGENSGLRGLKITGKAYKSVALSDGGRIEFVTFESTNDGSMIGCDALSRTKNVILRDNSFLGTAYSAFIIEGVDDTKVERNLIRGTFKTHPTLRHGTNLLVSKNIFEAGLMVENVSQSQISDNTFVGPTGTDALDLTNSNDTTIQRNDFENAGYAGITVRDSSDILVQKNNIRRSASYGIHADSSPNIKIFLNNIAGLSENPSKQYAGISVSDTTNSRIYENLITYSLIGISIRAAASPKIAHNTVATQTKFGLQTGDSSNLVIINNLFSVTTFFNGCLNAPPGPANPGTINTLPCMGESTIAINQGNWGNNGEGVPGINTGAIAFVNETNGDYRISKGPANNQGVNFTNATLTDFPNLDLKGTAFTGASTPLDPGAFQN